MRNLALLLPLLLCAGCVSGSDCALAIPEEMRADAIRWAIDKGLVKNGQAPEQDVSLGLGAGRAYKDLTEARRTALAPYVTGYAQCVHDRIVR